MASVAERSPKRSLIATAASESCPRKRKRVEEDAEEPVRRRRYNVGR